MLHPTGTFGNYKRVFSVSETDSLPNLSIHTIFESLLDFHWRENPIYSRVTSHVSHITTKGFFWQCKGSEKRWNKEVFARRLTSSHRSFQKTIMSTVVLFGNESNQGNVPLPICVCSCLHRALMQRHSSMSLSSPHLGKCSHKYPYSIFLRAAFISSFCVSIFIYLFALQGTVQHLCI